MSRQKSVSVKWTLVLVLVLFGQFVYSRPQIESTTLEVNVDIDKSTDVTPRYSYKHNNVSFKLPFEYILRLNNINNDLSKANNLNESFISPNSRTSRVIRKISKIRLNHATQNNLKHTDYHNELFPIKNANKPVIKKVVTKWTDNTKYEDSDVSHDTTISEERDSTLVNTLTSVNIPYSTSTEIHDESTENSKNLFYTPSNNKQYTVTYSKPLPQYEESHIYSSNVHVADPYVTRPNYAFTTPRPTPIITNVGYPKPWPDHVNYQSNKRPNKKPIKTNKPKDPPSYHSVNNFAPYPANNFDVTTFPPIMGYTDRIVIRPEQYSASSDDCPTIFVTLNNTFQGQGKEACPDLNIAVNTNVINKNVVVESEEDTDTTLTDVFGLPLDESGSDEAPIDYEDSQENDEQTEEVSNEELELSNYNAANNVNAESAEPANFASPTSALSTYTKPGRPNDDDDIFSSVIEFFKPAISVFSWLAAINPFSFSALSFILTPIVLLFAGASGLAALFTPWAFSARELPEYQIYKPYWEWDDYNKTWYLNSFPNNRRWQPSMRSVIDNHNVYFQFPWYEGIGNLLKSITQNLNVYSTKYNINNRKNRKKRKR